MMAHGSSLTFGAGAFSEYGISKTGNQKDMRLTIINNHEYLFDQIFENLPLKAPKRTISSI